MRLPVVEVNTSTVCLHTSPSKSSKCCCAAPLISSEKEVSRRSRRSTAWGPGAHRATLDTTSLLVSSGEVFVASRANQPGVSTTVTSRPDTLPCLFTHREVLDAVSNSCLPRTVFPVELFPDLLYPRMTTLRSVR